MRTGAPHTSRKDGARSGRTRPLLTVLIITALTGLCLNAQMIPSSSAGYLAKITNTTNNAGSASYFLCTDIVRSDISTAAFAYRLNEATGSASAGDYSNNNTPGTYQGSMVSDTTPRLPCPRDVGGAYLLNGSTSYITTSPLVTNPTVFTLEIWFKTTIAGGKLIGFGNAQTGPSTSTTYDRHLYIASTGQLVFGVSAGSPKTVISPKTYNDGSWHQAVATLSTAGMILYMDGQNVAADPATTTAQ
ncbi:LamG domain-containing protein, partial [Paenarthrobacter sp. Z7-10]|uniref:LamG-like jellyroll fold domain-containing protein n=1 Tax=Paenarthrobacter sp. Z7-10 TaxID=2787635 RepID=UPI0022A98A3A